MSTTSPGAGWYPDPAGGDGQRWWDGSQWTDHVEPPAPQGPAAPSGGPWGSSGPQPWGSQGAQPWGSSSAGPGEPPAAPQWGYQAGDAPPGSTATGTLWHRNQMSFITFIVVIVYVAIAIGVHGGLLGILPLGMSIRAMSRHEPLAPVALGVAIVGIVVGIASFA